MRIEYSLVGRTPLLYHNPRLVDPDDPITRQIKALTGKRKKTDEDRQQIERLEWFGGLFVSSNGAAPHIVLPATKVRKALINAAKISKLGKAVERAVSFEDLEVPLAYQGPADIETLFADERFHNRSSVVVSGRRVMRVRPQFLPWAATLRGVFIEDAGLNFDELVAIAELAGSAEGIGDYRVGGYGRFTGALREVR